MVKMFAPLGNKDLSNARISISLMSLLVYSTICLAEENDASAQIPELTVVGQEVERDKLERYLSKVPGGTNLVDLDELPTGRTTLNDVLGTEPGVVMQEFFGGNDQPRLNIRGSGIQDNPVNRGIQLLYDGMPVNQADGSFVIGLLDPQQTRMMSVYRGANAMRYGGASLGGAINLTPRTAQNSDSFVRLQGGSYNLVNGSVGLGGKQDSEDGGWDYYVGAGHSQMDGFRNFNEGERSNASLNVGYKFNDNVQNRSYLNYTDNYFDIPFVLQKQIALDNPESVIGDGVATDFPPPGALPTPAVGHPAFGWNAQGGWDGVFNINERKPHRDSEQLRLANKTTFTQGSIHHELGIYGEKLEDGFYGPLLHQVVDSSNLGLNYALENTGSWLTREDEIQLSLAYNSGEMPVEFWVNNPENGTHLFRFADLDQDATNTVFGLEYLGAPRENLQFDVALQWINSERDIKGSASTPPAPGAFDKEVVNLEKDFSSDAINPKVGVIFKPSTQTRLYANVSRSMEAPTFNQLVSRTVGPLIRPGAEVSPPAVPPFADAAIASGAKLIALEEQTALTYEIGSDGQWQDIHWQASYYHSKVKDELITLVTGFAVNAETLNYPDDTIHQGIELGLDAKVADGLVRGDDALAAKIIYNYSDFSFDGGVFDGNQIAGIPEHLVHAELAYSLGEQFYLAPNIRWQPSDAFVDHSNVQVQDDYLLFGLKAAYRPTASLSFFADLENITDETYQTSYVIRGISGPDQPTFIPGSGFNVSAGVSYTW